MEGDSQFEILDDESKTNSINFQEEKKIREISEPIQTLKLGITTFSLGDDKRKKVPLVQTDNN